MLKNVLAEANAFRKEAHQILSVHEKAASRVVLLDDTYQNLKGLTLKQEEIFKQALRCIESELYRAAYILAWITLMDLIEEKLSSNNFQKLKLARVKWNFSTIEELRENYSEYQIVDACKDTALLNKNEIKILHGYLAKRNLCAHPSTFVPDYNQTLGYVADILQTLEKIKNEKY